MTTAQTKPGADVIYKIVLFSCLEHRTGIYAETCSVRLQGMGEKQTNAVVGFMGW